VRGEGGSLWRHYRKNRPGLLIKISGTPLCIDRWPRLSHHALFLWWARSGTDYIPEAWRLCRFCQTAVEDELHAFMICDASPELVNARSAFRAEIDVIDPELRLLSDPYVYMTSALRRSDTIECVAKYLHVLHTVFPAVPVVVPPVESYRVIVT
jgi:hypothetical protein